MSGDGPNILAGYGGDGKREVDHSAVSVIPAAQKPARRCGPR
jgi:hypothetical protein